MIKLGDKSQIAGAKDWPTFRILRRPNKMPKVPKGHTIVCGIEEDGGEEEQMFPCEELHTLQLLYDQHARGHTGRITWYHTDALDKNAVVA